jgi:hypothetical protein
MRQDDNRFPLDIPALSATIRFWNFVEGSHGFHAQAHDEDDEDQVTANARGSLVLLLFEVTRAVSESGGFFVWLRQPSLVRRRAGRCTADDGRRTTDELE